MINGRIINSISTDAPDWQLECWKLAQGKKKFQVDGITDHHRSFCEELCLAYGYRPNYHQTKAVFTPLEAE